MPNLVQKAVIYNQLVFNTIFHNNKIYLELNSLCKSLNLSDSYYYKKLSQDQEIKDALVKEYVKGNHGLRKKIFLDLTYLDLFLKKLDNSYHNENYFIIKNDIHEIIKTVIESVNYPVPETSIEIQIEHHDIKKIHVYEQEFFSFIKDDKIYLPLRYTLEVLNIKINQCISFFQDNKHLIKNLRRSQLNNLSIVLIDIETLNDFLTNIDNKYNSFINIFTDHLNQSHSLKIPKTYMQTLSMLINSEDKNSNLEVENINLKLEIEELKQKAEMYDATISTVNFQDMKQISSVFGIGRNSLFNMLRDRHILMEGGEDHNLPYQKYINLGYFIVRRVIINRTSGKELKNQTLVTPKGVGFINRVLKNNSSQLNLPIDNYMIN